MKTVKLTYKQLCCLVGSTQIFERLCAQQERYMNENNLTECPVPDEVLRRYAMLCCDNFTEQLTLCATDADYEKLYGAYLERTERSGTDFLTPAEAIQAATMKSAAKAVSFLTQLGFENIDHAYTTRTESYMCVDREPADALRKRCKVSTIIGDCRLTFRAASKIQGGTKYAFFVQRVEPSGKLTDLGRMNFFHFVGDPFTIVTLHAES